MELSASRILYLQKLKNKMEPGTSTVNFCTLFNINYLSRGLLMYESLIRNEPSSHLYIFPFDEKTFKILNQLKLANATIVVLSEFENEKLLSAKSTRTATEYCWTCTPSIISYTIKNFKVSSCTYLDADLYFYSNPSVLIKEMPEAYSVLITPHRYSSQYDQSDISGTYCVQFVTFKNNEDSLQILERWQDQCIEWCYNKSEDGKFGDQKYLDDWPEKYKNIVWVLRNKGGGVAPWNVQQYTFYKNNNKKLYGTETITGTEFELIFFHFHSITFQKLISNFIHKKIVNFYTGYLLSDNCIQLIYKPYAKTLLSKAYSLQRNLKVKINSTSEIRISLIEVFKEKLKIFFQTK